MRQVPNTETFVVGPAKLAGYFEEFPDIGLAFFLRACANESNEMMVVCGEYRGQEHKFLIFSGPGIQENCSIIFIQGAQLIVRDAKLNELGRICPMDHAPVCPDHVVLS